MKTYDAHIERVKAMQEITAYQATDGKIFANAESARRYDASLRLDAWAVREGIGRGGEWDGEMLVSQIRENANEILEILGAMTGRD